MAAQQAAEIYDRATVHVIPSKNIGTGYAAISSADLENDDPEAIITEMTNAMKRVTAGYISPSVRDADMNGVHITKGDTIGIIEKEIVVSEPNRLEAAKKLVNVLLGVDGKFMITVFTGKDAESEECNELESYIKTVHPSAEIYFVEGGQEVYPYIFAAE